MKKTKETKETIKPRHLPYMASCWIFMERTPEFAAPTEMPDMVPPGAAIFFQTEVLPSVSIWGLYALTRKETAFSFRKPRRL
jgi:hypothetical protein